MLAPRPARPLLMPPVPHRRAAGAGVFVPHWYNLDTVLVDDFPRV